MSLPAAYSTPSEYFAAAINFLHAHAWVYQEANTRFLKANILERMPLEFRNYFMQITNEDLNTFPFVREQLAASTLGISAFRQKLFELIPASAFDDVQSNSVGFRESKPPHMMSTKKRHEITELAALIHSNCLDTPLLVDMGAGLGYLSEMLYTLNPNYLILGLEADANRVKASVKRCSERLPQATAAKSIIYRQQFINEDSRLFIEREAKLLTTHADANVTELPKMSLIGLHACADLSVSSLKLFLSMPQVRRLIIMPCCYHKLEQKKTTTGFVNFPLSAALKGVIKHMEDKYGDSASYLNRPFLRLACQQTSARWRDMTDEMHLTHGRQMMLRALAEAIIDDNANEYVAKLKRQTQSTSSETLTLAFADLRQTFVLQRHTKETTPLEWLPAHEMRFNQINNEYKDERGFRLAEALTCLQTAMQKLCENILLYDRLCFLEESAVAQQQPLTVSYKKILDEKLSPRCYVLLAEKLT